MSDFGIYTPNTPSATFYVIEGLSAVTPEAGGEARFLHVMYKGPLEHQGSGS